MFDKKNSIYWLLAAVVIVTALVLIFGKGKTNSTTTQIKTTLNEISSNTIDKITYRTANNGFDVKVQKNDDNSWSMHVNGKTYPVDTVKVQTMFLQALNLRPLRLADGDKDKWKIYEVDKKGATHVEMYSKGNKVANFYVGKFEVITTDPAAGKNTHTTRPAQSIYASYMRLADDNNIYVVNGNVRFSFPDDYNFLRSQFIYNLRAKDITDIKVDTKQGVHINLAKDATGHWHNNMTNRSADSVAAQSYAARLRVMICNRFVEELPKVEPDAIMSIKGTSFDPVEVKFYPAETEGDYIIQSSFNSDGIFLDKKGILRKRIEKFQEPPRLVIDKKIK